MGFIMNASQYKAALKVLGLSQHRAADWLGIGRRTSQAYAIGEWPLPKHIAMLIRLCLKFNLKPDDVER